MKKILFMLYCICIIGLLLRCNASATEKLSEVPPYYQGLWKIVALSTDQGNTITQGDFSTFCKVGSYTVEKLDGKLLFISDVLYTVENNLSYTAIHFSDNNIIWIIEPKPQNKILVHVIDKDNNNKETLQVIFFVDKSN